jgi:hypothetical protein
VVVVGLLLDRLMHHGHLLKLDGKSWRLKEATARLAKHATADQGTSDQAFHSVIVSEAKQSMCMNALEFLDRHGATRLAMTA